MVLLRDVMRNPFYALADRIDACGNGCGDKRRGSMPSHRFRNLGKGFVGALHDVMAAGAMDMDVDESRNGGLVRGGNFLCAGGQSNAGEGPHRINDAISNQNPRVGNFGSGADEARATCKVWSWIEQTS